MPSTASTQGIINTASCPNATIMIKTDPRVGSGETGGSSLSHGTFAIEKMEMA